MKQFDKVLTVAMPISMKMKKLQSEVWDDGPYDANHRFVDSPRIPKSSISANSSFPTPASSPLNFSGYQNLLNIYLEGPLVDLPEYYQLYQAYFGKKPITASPDGEARKAAKPTEASISLEFLQGKNYGCHSQPNLPPKNPGHIPSLHLLENSHSGGLKLNIGSTVKSGKIPNTAAIGLLRNEDGMWITGFIGNLGTCPILTTELWPIRTGLTMAWEMRPHNIIMEADSEAAIQCIRSTNSDPHPAESIINDC
ncbi:unnamed protein product [Ilex paraguariensis]|uniref:RNase H type-1 domain-containing protein n=1 Tax=Ilex paraguariensis TaxID=185542 RepID=A0ABC8SE05_9AQUA